VVIGVAIIYIIEKGFNPLGGTQVPPYPLLVVESLGD
jgi:hypothetical protein